MSITLSTEYVQTYPILGESELYVYGVEADRREDVGVP